MRLPLHCHAERASARLGARPHGERTLWRRRRLLVLVLVLVLRRMAILWPCYASYDMYVMRVTMMLYI